MAGMKKRQVIGSGSIQTRMPLFATLMWWMFLDYTNAPGWVYGALGVLIVFVWGVWIYRLFTDETIDLTKEDAPAKLRKWAERLEQLRTK